MVIFRQFPDIFGGIRAEHWAQKFDSTNSASLRGRQDKKIILIFCNLSKLKCFS